MKPPSVHSRIGAGTVIPTCHATDLMLLNDAAIARIRMCFGIDAAAFEVQILPIIQRLADYVLNLPATRDAYYCHPGGMFEFALEVGFFTLQGTDSCIFAGRSTISVRRHLEPRWRLATFLAGLLNVLEPAAGLAIVEDDTGGRWPALIAPLGPWLHARAAAGYRLGWRSDHQDAAGFGLLALPLVVTAATLQYLGEDNDEVLPALLASLAGLARYRDRSPLPKLLRRAAALVVHTWSEKADMPEEAEDRQAHVQHCLLDAMRRLAASHPHWLPNRDKSRVWLGSDGLYLVWPQSAADILAALDEDGLAGMPRSAPTMLAVLDKAGSLQPGQKPPSPIWTIQPPISSGPLEALKLASVAVLFPFDAYQPVPLGEAIATQRQPPPPTSVHPRPRTGDQLDLALTDAARNQPDSTRSVVEPAEPDRALPDTEPRVPHLRPPLRLDRTVAAAVEAFIQRQDATGRKALLSSQGFFVPISCFRDSGLEAYLVIAAMDSAGILVKGPNGRANSVQQEIGGAVEVGVLIASRFFSGI